MNLTDNVKEIYTSFLEQLGKAVWIEVVTEDPQCTYYFGPFTSFAEAEEAKLGYLEDLDREGAKRINAVIKRCKPERLTIFDESIDTRINRTPSLSGQTY